MFNQLTLAQGFYLYFIFKFPFCFLFVYLLVFRINLGMDQMNNKKSKFH